jgi:hypothetical protein
MLEEFYADEVRRAAEASTDERTIREWVQEHLITEQDLRGQVPLGYQVSKGLPNDIIDSLVNGYVLRREQSQGRTWFELAHDRLIGPVKRNNAEWLRANRTDFQAQAVLWAKRDQSDELLAPRELLRQGEELNRQGKLTPNERGYLLRSREHEERAKRRRRLQAERRTNLADLGWGVIFASNADPAIEEALAELLKLRREQAGGHNPEYFKIFKGEQGYRPGETTRDFLSRHEAGIGLPKPEKVPYYLLIVGDPEVIPWEFQYGLDIAYAVGRLHFDTLAEYSHYSKSVQAAEKRGSRLPRRVTLFGPQHESLLPSDLGMKYLLQPLREELQTALSGWDIETVFGEAATKARLSRLLGGDETPALLFSAGTAMSFPSTHRDQQRFQGALLCQDWPGFGKVKREHYLAAEDVSEDAQLQAGVVFLFAPFSAGTPRVSNFFKPLSSSQGKSSAPRAFMSRLPQRLLGHPNGGALAVIGHVDEVFVQSFLVMGFSKTGIPDIHHFKESLRCILEGYTIGSAMEPFSHRYANLSADLSEKLLPSVFGQEGGDKVERTTIDDRELQSLLTWTRDARNYVVLGDPAVRLPGGEQPDRPSTTDHPA